MTNIQSARQGVISPAMQYVIDHEGIDAATLLQRVANGTIAIPANPRHTALKPSGIGLGMRTKINVNLGVSADALDYTLEQDKVRLAMEMGADAIMDLSCYGKTASFREWLIANTHCAVGTVPVYDAIGFHDKPIEQLTSDDLFNVVERHAKDGVDFVTIHAGLNRHTAERFARSNRRCGIVSRGGSFIYEFMRVTGGENPFYERYDELLDILAQYDVTISLGDACRPGCIADATDASQIEELITLGELTLRAWEKGVTVMVEGPGHMAINEIAANMLLEKRLCHNAPFYVLGPLVTDIGAGYDHITAAIGGAVAAASGADFLCYVTPAEHLRLPDIDDVRDGIAASLIAAHAGDIAKGIPGATDRDTRMTDARVALNWKGMCDNAIDPPTARGYHAGAIADGEPCTMCGDMCAVKRMNNQRDTNHQPHRNDQRDQ